MESFKEEHSDGKVFSMDIQKLKNYASKHKMKVALGTTMAAALIAGASAGTYAYFTSQASANTNLTLNKGTVTLGEVPNSNWKYLGNSTDINTLSDKDKYNDISLNGISTEPNATYTGRVINPNLVNSDNKNINEYINEYINNHTKNVAFSGASFSNIVPGDVFRKTYDIQYTGSNDAEISLKLKWGDTESSKTDWTKFNEYFNYIVEYRILNNDKTVSFGPVNLFSNYASSPKISNYNDFILKGYKFKDDENSKPVLVKKDQTIELAVTVKLKNADYTVDEQNNLPPSIKSVGTDGFTLTVQNHLESK